ncbi:phage terminase large subunit [Microvirga sesbaniae]|uniref:phage terminase large subunit n=1 Tax=Microvirga sesbaniae TaxID=681392 RepID=UPI0021CA7FC1|nr:phage terminase large subunit [Microvirga sp. HBU67692]
MKTLPLSQQDAARELLRRRRIRRSFVDFCRATGLEPAPHHRLLATKLQDLAEGKIQNLLIFMPPGSAKSTYTSQLFPAWYFAQPHAGNIIAASHSTELAERFGRKVRGWVLNQRTALGYGVSGESSAAGRWMTTRGQEYLAAGVGTGIAGFRAKIGLIDDPFRSRQDADSALVRNRVWEWFNDDFDTRIVPGGGRALVMTRWHDDDLAGRWIARAQSTGERLEIISLPAVAEDNDPLGRAPGEWLWEGEYGYADLLRAKRRTADPRTWASLYQQNPVPDGGDYFRAEWIRPVAALPPTGTLRIYGASDYAVTADGGDYTVHVVAGLDPEGRMYLLDLWRRQAASDAWVEAWCDLVLTWKPREWAEEQGQIRAGVGPFLDKRARERGAYCARTQFPTRGDKAVRAQSIRGRMAMEGLYVPAAAPWTNDFVAELLRFPAGVHDDQADALGLLGQLLDTMRNGTAPATAARPPRPGYRPIGARAPAPSANTL